jgi:sulfate transport system substrate-binding protein
MKRPLILISLLISFALITPFSLAQSPNKNTLLNVSYDVSRELYKDINAAFISDWKSKTGEQITINQSHGGSSKQAGSIIGGLEADVVTLNQAPDIDILYERGKLISQDWRKAFPKDASPYSSVTVFLVRKGNPKNIKDWGDLIKPKTQVIIPNPKTSGNGRYTYLAAYGYALQKTKNEKQSLDFVRDVFKNVPILDGGGRGATTSFTQRDIGDVIITFENEAELIIKEFGAGQFELIYPSITIEAPAPVAVVEKYAKKHGSEKLAKAYLDFLYTDIGQEIIAKHYLRPRNPTPAMTKKYAASFPDVKTFSVESTLGGWKKVQKEHFDDGALFDQMMIGIVKNRGS